MISKINLLDVASYPKKEVTSISPLKINYFYGCNGSGKSTIANYLNNINDNNYNSCSLEWYQNNPMEILVYSKEFVKENFSTSSEIKGIFTLGKESTDTLKFIEKGQETISNLNKNILSTNNKIDEYKTSLSNLISEFQDLFWNAKLSYAPDFGKAMQGFLGRKSDFFNKCLIEYTDKKETTESRDSILTRYKRVFETDIKEYPLLKTLDIPTISLNEVCDLLDKVIAGKDDLPIGELITKLSNSDWVKRGIDYFAESDKRCPFCQRTMSDDLIEEITSYFDITYQNNCNEIKLFKIKYTNFFNDIILKLKSLSTDDYPIADFTNYFTIIKIIEENYMHNIEILDSKINMPSTKISIISLHEHFESLNNEIKSINTEINNNNSVYSNLDIEKKSIVASVWQIIISEISPSINVYLKQKSDLDKAILNLRSTLESNIENRNTLASEIQSREASITSVEHTVVEINKILNAFGFTSFKLKSTEKKGTYRIERPNGEDAISTLSEGEYRFITFLYFYHLLKGSFNSSGLSSEKVVVIDDPISSLDSNTLFIISTLSKDIINRCLEDEDGLKQVFILTHNTYFYKEVTYKGSRNTASPNKEAYWIIQKAKNISSIRRFETNPILTTYESLWRMLDDTNNFSDDSILLNAMRRILEYYFNVLCGYDYEKCISDFDGEEKLVCKTLLSYINDGSHFISDDFILCYDDIEKYLKVFKKIFDNLGHINHYKAMTDKRRCWKYI